jgi:Trk K+ transport system NAD-binding subunit
VERPVVLCGLGQVGWRVLESVRAAGLSLVAVDLNTSPDDPRLRGVRSVKGDCRRAEVLEDAGIRDAGAVLILTSDDLTNVTTALLVRKINPTARVVVRMFNQNLVERLGAAMKNTVALSVSGLTAPLLALTAVTGDALGAFRLDDGPRQVSEIVVASNSSLAGKRIADLAREHRLLPMAFTPAGGGKSQFLLDVTAETPLSSGDRLVVCGSPMDLLRLVERERGELLPGVRWAGRFRRWLRTARRTLLEVDLSVKIATPLLFCTILISTMIFWYGFGTDLVDGLYNTVNIVATGAELHGEDRPQWAKIFLSVLKLAGAALIAAFTAIFTQYLIRAKLGGALEVRRVPDGGHVVVCGLGNIGYRLVNELIEIGERVVAIDRVADNPFIATVRRKGVPTFVGDATLPDVLKQARAETAKAVIAATSSELANLEIALLAREANPQQRVVVRLNDPLFAEAARDAADIRQAMSIPSLAAPAFVAALFGDRVQSLVTAAGRTFAVIDLVIEPGETHLEGRSLRAVVLDYRLLPISFRGSLTDSSAEGRLMAGDRLTVVAELPDLERLIRRQPVPAASSVLVESVPTTAREALGMLVMVKQNRSMEEAERVLSKVPFTLAGGLTHGEAQEMVEQLAREGIEARVAIPAPTSS